MRKEQFESRIRELLPEVSDTAIKQWTEYAQELDQDGTEPEADFYDSAYVELTLIKQHQGEQAATELFNFGEHFTFNPFELRGAASLLLKGWPLDEIKAYTMENGCDSTAEEYEESQEALRAFRNSQQESPSLLSSQQSENQILNLASEIKRLTGGLCSVGVGPYGFGVDNDNSSEIGLVIKETPPFFPDGPESQHSLEGTLTVEAYRKEDGTALNREAVEQLLQSSQNEATQTIAKAAAELNKTPVHVASEEYEAAYNTLAEQALSDAGIQMQTM